MQAEEPPVDSVWTMSTHLWPDKQAMIGLHLVRRMRLNEEEREREFAFVMSSPQFLAMNE